MSSGRQRQLKIRLNDGEHKKNTKLKDNSIDYLLGNDVEGYHVFELYNKLSQEQKLSRAGVRVTFLI